MGEHRLHELLAGRATADLTEVESRELDSMLAERGRDDDSFDLAAAAVHLAVAGARPLDPLPAPLRARLLESGRAVVGTTEGADVVRFERAPARPPAPGRLGWWAAAAALALAMIGWWPRLVAPPAETTAEARSPGPVVERSLAEQRQALLSEADALVLEWSATEDPAATGAGGDVVWSPSLQRGFLRIRDLEANDPRIAQYQLWVFDRARDERYPVDGGVFDVAADGAEVIVPIDAKVAVDQAYLFAVTVERPGGVVVSDRERIVLVAQA